VKSELIPPAPFSWKEKGESEAGALKVPFSWKEKGESEAGALKAPFSFEEKGI